jgi:signal transduction histidine kinase
MDVDFKRNLVKLLSGALWLVIPLFAVFLLILPHPPLPEIQYEEVMLLLFFTLLLNIGVALLPMRQPFIVRYNNVLFFVLAVFFELAALLAILYTGGVKSLLFPFLLLVTCFGTTFYASLITSLLLILGLSTTYTVMIVRYSDFGRLDIQWLASQILFLFLITFFINRLGQDSREQVRIKNEALRELKLLSEMDQATSNFVSAVSFEMRTPLTSIQGFSEMLLHQGLSEDKEREFIDIINKEAEHLTELVEELLDISRLESGKAKLKREEVEIKRMMRKSLQPLETVCAPGDLVVDFPDELPTLYLDRNRIRKVMSTLFHHLSKDCEDGAEVRVSAKTAENSLVLTINYRPVQEKGRESDGEFLEAIGFEPREEDLDIAIARRIILAHGGSMNIVHAPGHWSTIVFRLPVMELEEYLAEERGFTV